MINKSMKKIYFFLIFQLLFQISFAQQWAWYGGTASFTSVGKYGTKGVSSPNNNPGSRKDGVLWVKDESLYLFGGELYNDVWKYDTLEREWTWIQGDTTPNSKGVYGTMGVEAPTNKPGGRRGFGHWIDGEGNLWIYGGIGSNETSNYQSLGDLWKYNITTNIWTWVGGSKTFQAPVWLTAGEPNENSTPGCREGVSSWVDKNGMFWLFGGYGYDYSTASSEQYLNDIWKFDPLTLKWTWYKGKSPRLSSETGLPPARKSGVSFQDSEGNLWIYGGERAAISFMSDLYKFSIETNQWTRVGGSGLGNNPPNYGILEEEGQYVSPGGVAYPMIYKKGDEIFLYGGQLFSSNGYSLYNHTFRLNTNNGYWTWMGGNTPNQNPSYGTKYVPSVTNTPGGLARSIYTVDDNNFVWSYGGVAKNYTTRSDFWNIQFPIIITSNFPQTFGQEFAACYPNPSTGIVYFNQTKLEGAQYVTISDFKGNMVQKLDFTENHSLNLQAGIYLIEFWDKNGLLAREKLLVQ